LFLYFFSHLLGTAIENLTANSALLFTGIHKQILPEDNERDPWGEVVEKKQVDPIHILMMIPTKRH
jgi:hypothetical protein